MTIKTLGTHHIVKATVNNLVHARLFCCMHLMFSKFVIHLKPALLTALNHENTCVHQGSTKETEPAAEFY